MPISAGPERASSVTDTLRGITLNKKLLACLSDDQLTDEQLEELERQTVARLAEVLPSWSQQLGPGLDMVFGGLGLIVKEIDSVATELEAAKATEFELRVATLRVLDAMLAAPALPNFRKHNATRIRVLGGKKNAQTQTLYDTRTVELIAEDFLAWYDEVGLGGFVGSLHELVKLFTEVFHGYLDDESVERKTVFFMTAFEMRNRLGKVPPEVLGALEMLAADVPTEGAPA